MGSYSRTYNFTNGTVAYGDQVAFEFDAVGSSVNNIVNAQISSGAAIADTKLAQITTASKVSATAVTGDLGIDVLSNAAPLMGAHRNLKVIRNSVTQVTVTADELCLQNSSSDGIRITSVSEVIDITVAGAGGLDTGAEGNKWYYIWIIRKSADGTVNGLLSASATSPTLPSGYDQYAVVSAVHNTSGDFVDFIQEGRNYFYSVSVTAASGTTSGATTAIDITEVVPASISTDVFGTIWGNGSACFISNLNASFGGGGGTNLFEVDTASVMKLWELNTITANTLYWESNNASAKAYVHGFRINKIV